MNWVQNRIQMSIRIFPVWLAVLMVFGCKTKTVVVTYSRTELKKRTFNYFWDLADRNTYQIPDRFPSLTFSSIAATGFGLSSYLAGIENDFISREQGADRVLRTLKVLWNLPQGQDSTGVSGYKGFFYHFLNLDDATRYRKVELSSMDTGLLMAGILSCQSFFDDPANKTETAIRNLSDSLYRRVDWNWMMKKNGKMSMGWQPESGFLQSEWIGYNEAMVLLVMALGSPSHPIPSNAWTAWCESYTVDTFYGYKHVQFDPLFGHQYSHIWIDFRGIRDSFMRSLNDDYFENSRKATLSNRAYCIVNPSGYKGYSGKCWGLTACDGPANKKIISNGIERQYYDYRARGACSFRIVDDGTIAPTAAGGSFPFTPGESEACLEYIWNTFSDRMVGKYGFKDAFNLSYSDENYPLGWFDIDYLGIDQGPILLQIQNHETELIWNTIGKNPFIIDGLKKAGFTGGWLTDL